MLLREEDHRLVLITQHNHALLSGHIAHHWRGIEGETRLSHYLLLAISMHDYPWLEADGDPLWNPGKNRPYDFIDYPQTKRLSLYDRGLRKVAHIHPYLGFLVSLHYTTFGGTKDLTDFQNREKKRRERLLKAIPSQIISEPTEKALQFLKLFDNLSLYICLCPPTSLEKSRPDWLTASRILSTTSTKNLQMEWKDPHTLLFEPYPFDKELSLQIPYFSFSQKKFSTPLEWKEKWRLRSEKFWTVKFSSPGD